MNIGALAANCVWFGHAAWKSRRWRFATRNAQDVQAMVLRDILVANVSTEFGTEHRFLFVNSPEEYQRAVPIRSYEDFLPYIARVAEGEKNVLTNESVTHFGITSGSSGASKLVPYTAGLMEDFRRGIDPWVSRLFLRHPSLMLGKAYWSVTPVGQQKLHTSGGIPVGFEDEREYFDPVAKWVLDTIMCAPSELAQIENMDAFRYATLRFLVQEPDLTWISIWNPTFFTLLTDHLEEHIEQLADDVEDGSLSIDMRLGEEETIRISEKLLESPAHADHLRLSRAQSKTLPELVSKLWPRMKLISCWAHGHAGQNVGALRELFPHAIIEPKGLMATEGFTSFPYRRHMSALSLLSHFFEFEDVLNGELLLAHQLKRGRHYSVILTTSGGLYRYRTHDVVHVDEHMGKCPLIHFTGRENKVVDRYGEKLNEGFVRACMEDVILHTGIRLNFWMLAPERNRYTLFIQAAADTPPGILAALAHTLDERMRKGFHYGYCRSLGQLSHSAVFLIDNACDPHAIYLETCAKRGQRLGDVKEMALHSYDEWAQHFPGKHL